MAKRIVDGEALWSSDKLTRVHPVRYRPEYANLLPLAAADGIFEAEPAKVWRLVYSYNRPEVSAAECNKILEAFEQAKMIFRWADDSGKQWGFFVGIDKLGRLPAKSQVARKNFPTSGAVVPADKLAAFVGASSQPIPEPVPAVAPEAKTKPRRQGLPDTFAPNEGHRTLALSLGIDLDPMFAKFRDHHVSKGTQFVDWSAAFRNWMRNERKFSSNGNGKDRSHQTVLANAQEVHRDSLKGERTQ